MSDQATGDVPATELLYHTDAYARSIEATVCGIDPDTRGIADTGILNKCYPRGHDARAGTDSGGLRNPRPATAPA